MFKCGLCELTSKPGEKAVHVVTETRKSVYPFRQGANRFTSLEGEKMESDDPGGRGTEIVKEILSHQKCAEMRELCA